MSGGFNLSLKLYITTHIRHLHFVDTSRGLNRNSYWTS